MTSTHTQSMSQDLMETMYVLTTLSTDTTFITKRTECLEHITACYADLLVTGTGEEAIEQAYQQYVQLLNQEAAQFKELLDLRLA